MSISSKFTENYVQLWSSGIYSVDPTNLSTHYDQLLIHSVTAFSHTVTSDLEHVGNGYVVWWEYTQWDTSLSQSIMHIHLNTHSLTRDIILATPSSESTCDPGGAPLNYDRNTTMTIKSSIKCMELHYACKL